MKNQEILGQYLKANDLQLSDLTSLDVDDMLETCLEHNQMPTGDFSDFEACVNKAMWNLRMEEARAIFSGGQFRLNVDAYRWNIGRAITNRDSSKSMLSAALDYVDGLLEQDELYIGGCFSNDTI